METTNKDLIQSFLDIEKMIGSNKLIDECVNMLLAEQQRLLRFKINKIKAKKKNKIAGR